ncbi:anaerobic glycerol-3-phosphate dehydrogenase subunit GlpC [Avibacterium paragallinarum]|uniref:anaerobic glycerol-3-phosphate dehydrogenase subunit GlpC n=1 Tax=Avibacterium paragallinarum TaxID=728 RepID=UPI00021AD0C4|nr:anaerobic glycerol-3-phosphate dehydrogenase subunit GlpC [Avibacterium paragallinarum]AZI13500.1 anaerobic glycerol-3-phosphate dehydrogenase subunit C [Avibacterium paragallinarum]QIR10820.1 anaerobic glycerol-3-phosphate dehydrogenase subunit C [Avibacterium paragallinarum]QJE10328.1 anaerobic glycerol-3-phosphate dehydrogenase subunit C [Avibacterium paragallinarum]QJE12521.1 anaerobic glycerol-3-phosphate dehydrogenase subunit C [Avibacterium paragallinarum]QJE14725.1 anaerobic glycero
MNIQQLIENAKQNATLPPSHQYVDNSFESCIKCTACTAVCPVSKQNPLYPGPKQAGPDGERFRLKSAAFYDEALKYCTNCKRCEVACPSDVKIGDLIVRARNNHLKEQKKSLIHKLRDAVLSNTDIMGKLNTPFAPVVNTITGLKATKFLLEKTLKVSQHRSLPKYSFGSFRQWYKNNALERQRYYKDKVAYYHGCYVNYNNPQLGKDLIKVFNALDIGVMLLEKEKCCGLPLSVNGFPKRARQLAEFNLAQLENTIINQELDVVGTSSSCTMNLRDEYHHILGMDNAKVRPHINIVTKYLYQLFQRKNAPQFKSMPLKVAYHTACHVDKAGWAPYTLALLKLIPDLEVVMLPSQCCGIAGTYGFKAENYEVSQAIGKTLFEHIEEGQFDFVISECETCKWQIDMSTSVTCLHPITLLAKSIN